MGRVMSIISYLIIVSISGTKWNHIRSAKLMEAPLTEILRKSVSKCYTTFLFVVYFTEFLNLKHSFSYYF